MIWIHTENPFETCTRHNYLKMRIICGVTRDALNAAAAAGRPGIAPIAAFFDPIGLDFINNYDVWEESIGEHTGESQAMRNLLKTLSHPTARDWDIMAQGPYPDDTIRYQTLFPHHRIPFQQGHMDHRISAVHELSLAIGADPVLAALKALVDAFELQLNNERLNQHGDIELSKTLSTGLETKRIATADAMMFVEGSLIVLYYNQLQLVNPFFDLVNIKNHRQTVFDFMLAGNASRTLCKRTLHADEEISGFNDSDGSIRIGVTVAKNQAAVTGFSPGAHITVTTSNTDLGDIVHNKYLTVTNLSPTPAHVVVTLL